MTVGFVASETEPPGAHRRRGRGRRRPTGRSTCSPIPRAGSGSATVAFEADRRTARRRRPCPGRPGADPPLRHVRRGARPRTVVPARPGGDALPAPGSPADGRRGDDHDADRSDAGRCLRGADRGRAVPGVAHRLGHRRGDPVGRWTTGRRVAPDHPPGRRRAVVRHRCRGHAPGRRPTTLALQGRDPDGVTVRFDARPRARRRPRHDAALVGPDRPAAQVPDVRIDGRAAGPARPPPSMSRRSSDGSNPWPGSPS